jgi:hypothetical protein
VAGGSWSGGYGVSGIRVDPAELAVPARRFEVAGDGLDLLSRVLRSAAGWIVEGAGQPVLAQAGAVFGQASVALVGALGEESRLLGGKIRAAAVVYEVTDRTAVQVTSDDVAPDHRGRAV